MNYFSMCSGIGTGEKGIEQAFDNQHESTDTQQTNRIGRRVGVTGERRDGVLPTDDTSLRNAQCVGFSEIDKHAEAIYRYHWPDHRNYGDATRLIPDELPDFDFLIGGFPCQSFSIAGKRQGFDDARGTLFFEIARVLSHKRPRHFLLENVKGLSSHDSGRTIIAIHSILSGLGYRVERVLLNSKNHGVPQNRERVFFIGHLAERCAGEILSVGEVSSQPSKDGSKGERRLLGPVLDSNYWKGPDGKRTMIQVEETKGNSQGGRVYHPEGISSGLKSLGGGGSAKCPMIVEPHTQLPPIFAVNRAIAHSDRVGGMGSYGKKQNWAEYKIDSRIRRLTPVECERLQGCPDDFTKYGRYGDEIREVSDTQRYKGLGNSFTVNVIEDIVSEMIRKGCLA